MAEGRILRRLIQAGVGDDRLEFRRVAEEVIREERARKHHLLASDLERILYGGPLGSPVGGPPLPEPPRDRERGLPLLVVRAGVRDLGDIVLSAENRAVVDQVLLEQGRRDVLGAHGLRPLSRLLLCGPPGCGKTLAAEVLATELSLPLAIVRFDAVVSSFLGETAANLGRVFQFIEGNRLVVLFDEFDAIGKEREDPAELGELKRVVNSFLQMLDGYRGTSVLVAATNHEGMLDRALWRRFEEILVLEKPTLEQLRALLDAKSRGVRHELPLHDSRFLKRFHGLSHADVERVLIRAIKAMVLRDQEFLTAALVEEALLRERKRGPRKAR